jgi:hypothetical protein
MFTLQEKITMENNIRIFTGSQKKHLETVFCKYTGLKVLKADNTLIKKIKDELNIDQTTKISSIRHGGFSSVSAFIRVSYRTLWFSVSCCYNGGNYNDDTYYCIYWKDEFYIGDVEENGTLKNTNFQNWDLRLLDYKEQEKQYALVDQLKKQYETEREKIYFKFRDDYRLNS